MLMDYQAGFKWVGDNPRTQKGAFVNSVFKKYFNKRKIYCLYSGRRDFKGHETLQDDCIKK